MTVESEGGDFNRIGCPQDQGHECGCQVCQRAARESWDSEARERFRQFLEFMAEIDLATLQRLREEKQTKVERADAALDTLTPRTQKRLQRLRTEKRYNLTHAARALGVSRQTICDWVRKGRIAPKRDVRGHPIFTVLDIEKIIDWRIGLKSC